MDLLDEAGIPQPRSPILTDEDRAVLDGMARTQRQFYYASALFAGLAAGATIAYFIGYSDIVRTIIQWTLSGTGVALFLSAINIFGLYALKCPRCGEAYFVHAPWGPFSSQCGTCGLPLVLPDEKELEGT
ncbi:MAG: hypothetical protein ABSD30_02960 [Candidatus Binatus sp.]